MEKKSWHVIYVKPRTEKKVHERLIKSNIESWCPLNKVTKQWTDRKKVIEEPLFKSYVFVNVDSIDAAKVKHTVGVLNFVHYLGKPAIIRDKEILEIRKYLKLEDVTIELSDLEIFRKEDKVMVSSGVFMNKEGIILKEGKKRVYVQIESLNQVMVIEFNKSDLTRLPK